MVHRSPSLSRSQRNQREQKENRRIHIGQALLLPSPPDPPSSCSCYSDTIFTLDGSRLVNPRRIEATTASTSAYLENEVNRRAGLEVVVTRSMLVTLKPCARARHTRIRDVTM